MELIKESWKKEDIKEFQKYLKSMERPEKREWSTNILQTQLPVLCLTTPVIKDIVSKIHEGNYLEFIDLWIWEYYENTAINGCLINYIKDFKTKKKYLDIYSSKAENWATCDLLSFDVKGYEKEYYEMVLEYTKSSKPFVRRIGIYILFNFLDSDNYLDRIFSIFDSFPNEEHYYVNMMLGWLLSECIIKHRDKSIKYLKVSKLNDWALNKGIQKCRESRRVSDEDKDMLVQYKRKKKNSKETK